MCTPTNNRDCFRENKKTILLSGIVYASSVFCYHLISNKLISTIVPASLTFLSGKFFKINATSILSFGCIQEVNVINTTDWKTQFLDAEIAKKVQHQALNILIMGPGINIGRAAEVLSQQRIQHKEEETENSSLACEPKKGAVTPDVEVLYVYQGNPSQQLIDQARRNTSRKPPQVGVSYRGQCLGVQTCGNLVRIILASNKLEVVGFLRGPSIFNNFKTCSLPNFDENSSMIVPFSRKKDT